MPLACKTTFRFLAAIGPCVLVALALYRRELLVLPSTEVAVNTDLYTPDVRTATIGSEGNQTQLASETCIAIPTARRYQHNGSLAPVKYLSNLLHRLYADSQGTPMMVYVLDGEIEGVNEGKHTEVLEVEERWKNKGLTVVKGRVTKELLKEWERLGPGRDPVARWRLIPNNERVWFMKETMDALQVLSLCRKSGRPYTMFLEDDVLPTRGVWSALQRMVVSTGDINPQWAFFSLYSPSSWPWAKSLEGEGLPFWFPCCTQGLLFRNDNQFDELMALLLQKRDYLPIDHIIRVWEDCGKWPPAKYPIDLNKLKCSHTGYVASPALFQHVGKYTTLAARTHEVPKLGHYSVTWRDSM